MARPRKEESKVMRIPLSRVAEVEALLGRAASIPRGGYREPEVQRAEPTASAGVVRAAVLTPGVEVRACRDCGRMTAHPEKYGSHHFRRCGKWSEKDVGGSPVGTGSGEEETDPVVGSPVPVAVTEGFESPAPGPLGDPLGRLAVAQALLAKMEVK